MRCAALLLFLCGFAVTTAAKPILNVGYFSLPPHTQMSDRHRAPALCYFDLLAERMQRKVVYHNMPLSRLLKHLAENKLDMALILAKNEQREQQLVYPQQPFFVTRAALALRPGLTSELQNFMRQSDYRIVLWQQGYQTPQLNDFAGRTIILTGDNIPARAVEMLQKKRADAFYEPDLYSLQYELERFDLTHQLKILSFTGETLPLYSAFSSQGAARHLQAYEQAFSAQQARFPYQHYLQLHLQQNSDNKSTDNPGHCLALPESVK